MKTILLVALGGATGALLRVAIATSSQKYLGQHFPYGTLIANISGCLAFGFLTHYLPFTSLSAEWRTAVLGGFLGALTTFSTFGFESFGMLKSGQVKTALAHAAAHLLLGLGAVALGFYLGQSLSGKGADRPVAETAAVEASHEENRSLSDRAID